MGGKLESVQGALKDVIRAGQDLQIMEGKLKAIVAASSFFFRTESATEYATAKNAYANGWKPDSNVESEKSKAKKNVNDNCTEDEECKSKNCNTERSICVNGDKLDGGSCEFNDECYKGWYKCRDGSCMM